MKCMGCSKKSSEYGLVAQSTTSTIVLCKDCFNEEMDKRRGMNKMADKNIYNTLSWFHACKAFAECKVLPSQNPAKANQDK